MVTAFSVPSSSAALQVAITSFIASDNVGVTGYLVNESASQPLASAPGWRSSAPTSYTFVSAGAKTLYAWAKDAASRVSAAKTATVVITLPVVDTVAPVVTAFSMPSSSSLLTVPVSVFAASDNVRVTGFKITESSIAPLASASGWSGSPPTTFTFSAAGSRMAYAWAKDAAGKVSVSRSASVTITIPASGSLPVIPASALFNDDFDMQPDWSPDQRPEVTSCVRGSSCLTPVPAGYYDYRVAGLESCSNLDGHHNTLNINSAHPRGGAGKSFLMWNEPCYTRSGSWGSDGLLGVSFPEQKEIYVRYWIKFQPDWIWPTGVSPSPMQKFLHLSHLNKDLANVWDFFSGTQNKPRFTPQLAKFGGGTYRVQFGLPHSPLTPARDSSLSFNSNAYLGASPLDWTTPGPGDVPPPGDGNWHSFEFHVKMNDKGQANGMERAWYDGALVNTTNGIAWVPADDDPALWFWNHAWLGGNNSVLYTPQNEQWYAVDDFVVATHYTGPPPAPTNVVVTSPAAGAAHISWSAGTNQTAYLISGYRIHYGTAPDSLNQSVLSRDPSADIAGLISGQTYYFRVTAVKKATYDSNENESVRSPLVSVVVK